ncbi:HAMP domain-containing histidine kinase [Microaerobacter geothermalis]|uniref:sensor histidine kinase n=1 Tax=Microaerobacter geothermalis TaxID=674972 RepID=UPI001F2C6945|nr:HAMP domain-containing sensor histidine kinase [Microaerobacter geothermalis]MCF6093709.1 HAMP domain-containing histidine kinase [Microaerobacter geothermalis]
MKKSIFSKFILNHVIVLLLSFVLLFGFLMKFVTNYAYEQKLAELNQLAKNVKQLLKEQKRLTDDNGLELIKNFAEQRGIRIALLNRNGQIVGNSGVSNGFFTSFRLSEEEIARLKSGKPVGQLKELRRFKEPATLLIYPLRSPKKEQPLFLILASPLKGTKEAAAQFNLLLLKTGLISFIIALVLSWFLSKGMARRLFLLRQFAKQVASGYWDQVTPIPVHKEDEISQLARDMNIMGERLRESHQQLLIMEKRRQQFTADVTHELRTPLTSIRGLIEGMRKGLVEEKDKDKYLAIMEKETMRLIRLINELLDLEKIRSGKIELKKEVHSLNDILEIVIEQLQPLADEKGVGLNYEIQSETTIFGDYDRLQQIFMNLIKNGIQFTERGQIEVNGWMTDQGTMVTIQDSGVGIPPDHLCDIWDRFYKIDPSRTKSKGESGLGLAIVKQLVDAHQGDIRVESTPGVGTKFTLMFPVQ